MTELNQLRDTVSRWMLPLLWLHVPLAAVIAWGSGNGIAGPALAAAAVAALASLTWWRAPGAKSTRLTIAAAYIALVSILVAACRGSPLQIDGHMYYFAAMAVLAAYCDRDVILVAAAVTAVHHLTLNFLAPALVFPDGASLPRVLLHAAIVVLEAGALVWMAQRVAQLFENSARHLASAHAAAAEVAAAQAAATA